MTSIGSNTTRPGRPRLHANEAAARKVANDRLRSAMRSSGRVQRSVWLPREVWEGLRQLRHQSETSDAATLERILREALR
jgi:hypothetical protein